VLIEQAEHARQAGVLARALREVPEPRPSFERATEIHDDGWIEADAQPLLTPEGAPVSFREYPAEPYAALWERGIAQAIREDPYVGLLVSLHGSRFFRAQPHIQARLHAREDILLRELGLAGSHDALPPDVLVHHRWIDCLDRLSLMSCSDLPSPQRAEIAGVAYTASAVGEAIVVEPWPFGSPFDAAVRGVVARPARSEGDDPRVMLTRGRPVRITTRLRPAAGA
jgi:Protein of unknown function (DUF3891)